MMQRRLPGFDGRTGISIPMPQPLDPLRTTRDRLADWVSGLPFRVNRLRNRMSRLLNWIGRFPNPISRLWNPMNPF